jgi:hypothetical protein
MRLTLPLVWRRGLKIADSETEYERLLDAWRSRVQTTAVRGERLPLRGHHREDDAMTIAERQSLPKSAKVSVITNSILLARRIRDLQRRRQSLVTQQEQLRTQLPDWAVEPLRLVGMTSDEIRGLINDWSTAETEAGLDQIEQRLDEIDRQIEDLENLLVAMPSTSLDEIEAVIGLTVTRFREIIVSDPDDVFYDHGEARLLSLIERVHEDLCGMLQRARLDAS